LVKETVPPLKKVYEPPNSSMSDEEILLAYWSDPKTREQRMQERDALRREIHQKDVKTLNRWCGGVNLIIALVVIILVVAGGGSGVYFAYVRE
jgi:hypothetical protein